MTTPLAELASIDNAPINTVGKLFITDDNSAANSPVPMAAPQTPPVAKLSSHPARLSVSPALRRP
ncbi:hypothetical protein D3C80_2217180 [compost metagenome]